MCQVTSLFRGPREGGGGGGGATPLKNCFGFVPREPTPRAQGRKDCFRIPVHFSSFPLCPVTCRRGHTLLRYLSLHAQVQRADARIQVCLSPAGIGRSPWHLFRSSACDRVRIHLRVAGWHAPLLGCKSSRSGSSERTEWRGGRLGSTWGAGRCLLTQRGPRPPALPSSRLRPLLPAVEGVPSVCCTSVDRGWGAPGPALLSGCYHLCIQRLSSRACASDARVLYPEHGGPPGPEHLCGWGTSQWEEARLLVSTSPLSVCLSEVGVVSGEMKGCPRQGGWGLGSGYNCLRASGDSENGPITPLNLRGLRVH